MPPTYIHTYTRRIYTLVSFKNCNLLLLSTKSGRKIWPAIILDSGMHRCMIMRQKYVVVISSWSTLYVW